MITRMPTHPMAILIPSGNGFDFEGVEDTGSVFFFGAVLAIGIPFNKYSLLSLSYTQ
jgi:hypothetical protein